MEVSSKKKSGGKHLKRLVRKAQEKVSARALGDGDGSRANFNSLAEMGIKPVIKVAKNSVS